jgi:transcriptional regulator GlxA family with amidase domain
MEHFLVICLGSGMKDVFDKAAMKIKPTITTAKPQTVSAIFESILEIGFNKPAFSYEICEKYISAIVLSQSQNKPSHEQHDVSYKSFLMCKEYADANFMKIKSVQELAEECLLDRRYVTRLFGKYNKLCPYNYLQKLKTDKALNLLITSELSIKQIALMSGFDDPYHFSRVFKKRFNFSPSQYRANMSPCIAR